MAKERLRRILVLALPIMAGMVSQNLFNLVDTAMVGQLGDAALAAVGVGGFATFMAQALVLGVSAGVQATAARRKGEGQGALLAKPLNAAILLVVVAGPALSGPLYFLAPTFFPYLNQDPAVVEAAVPYFQVRVLAIVFMGINFAFRGYWNAIDRSKIYMATLIAMHAANVTLNYVFIFGKFGAPALGVMGAGVGSALATAFGAAIYLALGLRHARREGFLRLRPTRAEVAGLLRLSLPSGLQNLFFAAGYTVFYWILGRIGTAELAAANVLINLMLVAYLPAIGLGLAAATLVGQALGRRDPADAARWAWDVAKVGVVMLALLGMPMWIAPELLLSAFIHDPATLQVARLPMRLMGLVMASEGVAMVLMQALVGAGATGRVMAVSVSMQWLFFLPLAYLLGPVLGFGLLGLWILQGVNRVAVALIYVRLWRQGRWASITV